MIRYEAIRVGMLSLWPKGPGIRRFNRVRPSVCAVEPVPEPIGEPNGPDSSTMAAWRSDVSAVSFRQ